MSCATRVQEALAYLIEECGVGFTLINEQIGYFYHRVSFDLEIARGNHRVVFEDFKPHPGCDDPLAEAIGMVASIMSAIAEDDGEEPGEYSEAYASEYEVMCAMLGDDFETFLLLAEMEG